MSRILAKFGRFSWTLHKVVAHPLSEILYQVGCEKAGNYLHDITIPEHTPGTGHG